MSSKLISSQERPCLSDLRDLESSEDLFLSDDERFEEDPEELSFPDFPNSIFDTSFFDFSLSAVSLYYIEIESKKTPSIRMFCS